MATRSLLGFADEVVNTQTGAKYEVSTVSLSRGSMFYQTAVLKPSGFFRTLFRPKILYTHDCLDITAEFTHDAICSMVRDYPPAAWEQVGIRVITSMNDPHDPPELQGR
jgi:hypothetical protein